MKLICCFDVNGFATVMAVVLVLLLSIVMTLLQPHRQAISIDLPKVNQPISLPYAESENALMVEITRAGRIYFRHDLIELSQLSDKFRERLNQGAERKVYFKVDVHVKYAHVAEVLDIVRSAGISDIAFVSRQEPEIFLLNKNRTF